jgi:hypothetical protein
MCATPAMLACPAGYDHDTFSQSHQHQNRPGMHRYRPGGAFMVSFRSTSISRTAGLTVTLNPAGQ